MKRFGAMLALAAMLASDTVEAADCPWKSKNKSWCSGDQYKKDGKDGDTDCECKCVWKKDDNKCKDNEEFYTNGKKKYDTSGKLKSSGKATKEECGCKDKPPSCDKTCVEMNDKEGATAVEADYMQAAAPGCECTPKDSAMQCDKKYAGMWANDAAGEACPPMEMDKGAMSLLTTAAAGVATLLLF
jgi:hypothetical protein